MSHPISTVVLNLEDIAKAELECDVEWLDEINNRVTQCTNKATWVADIHDEVNEHTYERRLLCGECLFVATVKKDCPTDGAKLAINKIRL